MTAGEYDLGGQQDEESKEGVYSGGADGRDRDHGGPGRCGNSGFAGYVKKARAAEHLSECRAIYVAAQSCLEEAFLKAGEGTVTVEDLDMERFLKDVEELSGVGGIGSGEGTPGSGGSAGTFSIYLENGRDGAACTAVVFHGEGSDWVFDTVDGTYTEA